MAIPTATMLRYLRQIPGKTFYSSFRHADKFVTLISDKFLVFLLLILELPVRYQFGKYPLGVFASGRFFADLSDGSSQFAAQNETYLKRNYADNIAEYNTVLNSLISQRR